MGLAASLFFDTTSDAQTLHRRIKPSDEQYSSQQEYWNELRDFLVSELKDQFGVPVSSWLQGSYKFGTQIRPSSKGKEFDIDLGIYAEWRGDPEDGDIGPLELKDAVQELLIDYADDDQNDAREVSTPKQRCNRIHYNDDFHIDTPCYHLDRDADTRYLVTKNDEWEYSDPKALYLWWRDEIADELRPRARRLVQYLKMWAELAFDDGGKPSSILLTVLVAEALQEGAFQEASGDDEWFAEVVAFIADRLDDELVVANPVDTTENLNRLSNAENANFLEKIQELESTCYRALNAQSRAESAEVWSEVFEYFFPIPDDGSVLKEARDSLVPITFDPQVAVIAHPEISPMMAYNGTNQIGPIPRNCVIRFTLLNADRLPAGSVVKWMVRNEGVEAEDYNDLGHIAGSELTTTEHSAYKGTHYMDISVTQNGRLVGRRRIPVVVSGNAIRRPTRGRPTGISNKKR